MAKGVQAAESYGIASLASAAATDAMNAEPTDPERGTDIVSQKCADGAHLVIAQRSVDAFGESRCGAGEHGEDARAGGALQPRSSWKLGLLLGSWAGDAVG